MNTSSKISLSMVALVLATSAPLLAAAATDAIPTYTKDVAPILNASCVSCHRPNQIGPMSLLDYQEVRPWAKSIGKAAQARSMPPWHADPEIGHFKNDRSINQADIDTLVQWAKSGAPEGDLRQVDSILLE